MSKTVLEYKKIFDKNFNNIIVISVAKKESVSFLCKLQGIIDYIALWNNIIEQVSTPGLPLPLLERCYNYLLYWDSNCYLSLSDILANANYLYKPFLNALKEILCIEKISRAL